ncbi:hypothetical protein [Ruicaihuangia caeni]|uniref:MFS transporter n=1 Tax=Ruicaihuangia caeni TaxID=3042517 RepID=A0AAW6T374_9MICO|nr:hypothetical protein [Klugiella sp. YN-L-19]MDI2098270.1 hypothetical protein [Klugiella sp. YN-L-19]
MNISRHARLGRGLLAATLAVLTAALSHGIADGAAPSVLALVLGLAGAALVSVPLAGRKLSWAALVAAVVLSQAIFHGLFTLFGPQHSYVTGSAARASTQNHAHHLVTLADLGATQGAAVSAVDAHAGHDDAVMWVAHLAAAVVTVLALRHGESTLWRLFELALGWRVERMSQPLRPIRLSPARLLTSFTAPLRPVSLTIGGAARYRGPPVMSV